MTTYNTGNPIGSTAVKDLYDNAQNLDYAVNDLVKDTWVDRFGRNRTTLKGYDSAFQRFLINSGYQNIGDYAAGLEITARNQVFRKDGELYRAAAMLDLPYTTTGDWILEEPLFIAVGDAALRLELASAGGAGRIGTEQPYEGAVARTQAEKNAEIISRADFVDDESFVAAKASKVSIDGDGVFDAPAVDPFGTPDTLRHALIRALLGEQSVPSRPAFIEQHISSFFGRGMLPDEIEFIDTETVFTGSHSAGATVVAIFDTSKYTIGGCATIRHDNGVYGTYFISNISGTGLAITPPLRYPVSASGSAIARTWGDKVHPNNFYLRELAQRIAHCSEIDAAIPDQASVLFSGFVDNATKLADSLSVLGGAAIAYFDSSDTGVDGTFKTPVRFSLGKSAHITNIASIGNGVESPFFDTLGVSRACVCVTLSTLSNSTFFMRLTNESGVVVAQHEFTPATAPLPFSKQMFQADIRSSKRVKLSVTVGAVGTLPGSIAISQVDVFSQPELAGKVISKQSPVIVCIGDSWVAGSAPREPLTLQLGLELPRAKIINAGVGGQRILEMVNRFDTDVAPHQPDYVVVVTGTNESANPFSTVFYPNAVAEYIRLYRIMLEKIASIGARPIIVGAPALSQSVAAFEGRTQNANARGYAHYFAEFLSGKPVAAPRTITVTAGATPDVKGATVVKLNYPSATTVTNFLNGVEGQEIQIEALNGNATLQQFPFLLQGSVNVVLTANSVITLRRRDPVSTGAWVEVSRSIK